MNFQQQQHITEQNFQVIIRVRPLNFKQQQQIQTYQSAQSKKFKNTSNNKMIKLSPSAYSFYTKFYNVASLNDIMKVENNTTVYVIDTEYKNLQKKMKPYVFSNVYNQKETSEQIFQESIAEQIKCILQGYNYTILAYGITGSGKTHTVFGSHQKAHKGISGMALNYLLNQKRQLQKQPQTKVNLGFSFVEIYNENVRDLLNSQGKMLNIVQDSKGNTSFTDAIQIQITTQQQIHQLISVGLSKRSSGATLANQYSSRSHAILQMNIQIITSLNKITSKMFIIDLAGSQKIQSLNSVKKMQQGANINKSLLSLGNCINILADNSKKGLSASQVHIPYRDSKLTRILKDSLGGNAKTLMVACVSENPFTIEQTITTLNYAQRAQGIKKQIKRNSKLSNSQQQRIKLCSNCMNQLNTDSQISLSSRLQIPSSISSFLSNNNPKDQLIQAFFQQIYQDIYENIKQKFSIDQIAFEKKNRISSDEIQKVKQVNENQRLQLKQTMWKLFAQKQHDLQQKVAELNQWVETENKKVEEKKRLQQSKMRRKVSIEKKEKHKLSEHDKGYAENKYYQGDQNLNDQNLNRFENHDSLWNPAPPSSFEKRYSTQKIRSISLSRKPLQSKKNNQQVQNIPSPHQSIKFLLNQTPKQNEEQSNSRFSFASLLTSEHLRQHNSEQQIVQNQKSSEKLTKRKKSRSKFEVVKKMSASKIDCKEFIELSL